MSNATRLGQSPLRALAAAVQDQKYGLVSARYFCDLAVLNPPAPMRRLDVDALFRRGSYPSSFIFMARERQRVDDIVIVHDAYFEVGVGWRKGNGQPFWGHRLNARHYCMPLQQ